ncbi:hypothetical protein EMIT07CA2_20546 [Brevibacillus sp. IT-7CA2]
MVIKRWSYVYGPAPEYFMAGSECFWIPENGFTEMVENDVYLFADSYDGAVLDGDYLLTHGHYLQTVTVIIQAAFTLRAASFFVREPCNIAGFSHVPPKMGA